MELPCSSKTSRQHITKKRLLALFLLTQKEIAVDTEQELYEVLSGNITCEFVTKHIHKIVQDMIVHSYSVLDDTQTITHYEYCVSAARYGIVNRMFTVSLNGAVNNILSRILYSLYYHNKGTEEFTAEYIQDRCDALHRYIAEDDPGNGVPDWTIQ